MQEKLQADRTELEVLPPEQTPDTPDVDTKTGPKFFRDGAPNQVFRIELKWLSYGTDDKPHAASLLLSLMLGDLLIVVFIVGLVFDRTWIPDAIKILGIAFTFTAGVAIGKGSSDK